MRNFLLQHHKRRPALFTLMALAAVLLLQVAGGGSLAAAASQQESLYAAMQDFDALCLDKKLGMRRDSWEKLEKRFADIEKQATAYAAESFFYQARSREELADRSKNKNDWQAAAKLYGDFTARYKQHPLADNARYNRASILAERLNDKAGAVHELERIIAESPEGDALPAAIILRERLLQGEAPPPRQSAQPAAAQSAPAQRLAAQTSTQPSQADINKQRQLYNSAAAKWHQLLGDSKRVGLRESWTRIEDSFAEALKAAPAGPDAYKAAFQMARSRQELAQRSARATDWQEASRLFAYMAEKYPDNNLADDALYQRAEIMSARLNERTAAKAVLNELLARYPDGDMAPKARQLLSDLGSSAPAASSAGGSPAAAPSGSRAAARPASSSGGTTTLSSANAASQKVSGSSGSHATKAPANGAILRHLEWKGDSEKLVITLELAGKAKYRRNTLAADPAKNLPQRVRLDLLSTSLAPKLRQSVILTGVPVSAINSGVQSGGITRVEIDLADARSYKVNVLQNPYRLQVEVHATRLAAGGEDLEKIKPVSQTRAASNGNIVEQLGLSIKTIMIDAGHGGRDPGATSGGILEKNITLDLAKKLGAELKKKGFTVLYTREADRFVELADRTTLANSKKADIFVSLHVNSSTNKKLYGFETYYLDVARNDADRVVAAKENGVEVGEINDLQFILSDLTRNAKKEESQALSKAVQKACIGRLGRSGFTVRDNGVRTAPFYVLMGARMPALLVEIGYSSHSGDAARIKNSKYIQAVATGITDGVAEYQKQLNKLGR